MVWGKRFLRHLRGVHGGRGFPPRGALTRGACWLCCCLDSVQGMVQVRAVLRLVEFLKAVAFLSCLIRQLGDKYRGVGCEACSFSPFLNPLLLNSGASFPSVSVSKSPMVEQAVQTGSLDNLNSKKLLPGKGTVGMQLNGRPAPPGTKATTGT